MATTAIHQLIPTLSWGDAVGNMVRAWQAAIRGWGFRSEIFAGLTDERSKAEARPSKEYPQVADADSVLLVHHSIASGELPMLRRAPGRKAVVYHNITPGHFFEGHERHLVRA
ncbi:MAG TPA: glycosyl transferase family 1, partial [Myxococcaceae bacterium]|nr:glycosyl transferase family 1 [Myxococcaceae bacterium]